MLPYNKKLNTLVEFNISSYKAYTNVFINIFQLKRTRIIAFMTVDNFKFRKFHDDGLFMFSNAYF